MNLYGLFILGVSINDIPYSAKFLRGNFFADWSSETSRRNKFRGPRIL